jgi:hydrogenase maturation protein HypF
LKNSPLENSKLRRAFELKGVVQGVGFRPFVYGLAKKHSLQGWVKNASAGVYLEVEGHPQSIEQFTQQLSLEAPARSRIESLKFVDLAPGGFGTFEIQESLEEEGQYQLISPDIATCPACREEIFDPRDRRYCYPFTNCTNCGPRFTIIEDIPYDRPKTTMAPFRMCPDCRREYGDPSDRRFHAQPNACPVCGPKLQLVDPEGKSISAPEPISTAIRLLKEGKILALKGLGGFLLACDAENLSAVETLRRRKHRPDKPLALMLPDFPSVEKHCWVNEEEKRLLQSPESPIVLLSWKEGSSIVRAVAPGQKYLGVMLPYTPLHHLLMKESGMALVMTSGNLSEEPIAKDNDEAFSRLAGIADAFLLHDRGIFVQYDDSVTAVVGGTPSILRRSRGYAPFPVTLPFSLKPILACGAELKNTFCLTRDRYALVSQHIGDMENLETFTHFQRTLALYRKLFRIQPEIVAYDLHPEYLATKFALQLSIDKKIGIQHHYAHMASCMAENGEAGPVIGLSFDGLGYGPDGTLWGGECLVGGFGFYHRVSYFEPVPMPGGAAAIQHPWRMALSYLYHFWGEEGLIPSLPFLSSLGDEKVRVVLKQIDQRINSPLTSSCGRLFDAVSALLGLVSSISYEGQAAVALEMIADEREKRSYDFLLEEKGEAQVIRFQPLFAQILRDLQQGEGKAAISAKFHNTLVKIGADVCREIHRRGGPKKVTLSGGVFQNRFLLERMKAALENAGFDVLIHRQVPCNDGGLSLGQAVIANFAC